jgi:hypothetical protein
MTRAICPRRDPPMRSCMPSIMLELNARINDRCCAPATTTTSSMPRRWRTCANARWPAASVDQTLSPLREPGADGAARLADVRAAISELLISRRLLSMSPNVIASRCMQIASNTRPSAMGRVLGSRVWQKHRTKLRRPPRPVCLRLRFAKSLSIASRSVCSSRGRNSSLTSSALSPSGHDKTEDRTHPRK